MSSHPRFLVCGWSDADVGLVRPVIEEAGCVLDITFRETDHAGPPFDPAVHTGLVILSDGPEHSDDVACCGREMGWVRAARRQGNPCSASAT
jgi:hypothetical protein